jgi:hypothetical protein
MYASMAPRMGRCVGAAMGCLLLAAGCSSSSGGHPVRSVVTTTVTAGMVDYGPRVQVGAPVSFQGAVTPAQAGRTVVLQTRSGLADWTPVADTTTDATGHYGIGLPTTTAGSVSVRVQVPSTTSASAAATDPVQLDIDDFVAVRSAYLACVTPEANADNAVSDGIDAANAGKLTFSRLKARDAALSRAYRTEIACLKRHAWPPASAATVADIEANDAVMVACEAVAARATTTAEYNHACRTRAAKAAFAALRADDEALKTTMFPS